MRTVNKQMLIPIIIAAIGIPLAFTLGRGSANQSLQDQFDQALDELQTTHDVYLETMEETLQAAKAEWNLKYEQHQRLIREALLNTGISLEDLDAVPPPEDPNYPVTQSTYETLKNGMSYDQVLQIIGREGENTFNMLDEDGIGMQTFTWRWLSDDAENETLIVTFENGVLSSKDYSAFEL
jgi:hypothetical protein